MSEHTLDVFVFRYFFYNEKRFLIFRASSPDFYVPSQPKTQCQQSMASSKNKDSKTLARCFRCKHAVFMQWLENPIIADCQIRHERFVAMIDRQCPLFEPSYIEEPEITHYDHYEDADNF